MTINQLHDLDLKRWDFALATVRVEAPIRKLLISALASHPGVKHTRHNERPPKLSRRSCRFILR
jgi:hypothetical protein